MANPPLQKFAVKLQANINKYIQIDFRNQKSIENRCYVRKKASKNVNY